MTRLSTNNPRKLCIICEAPIFRKNSNLEHTRKARTRRSKHAVTCSPKCSRIYRRIYEYIEIQVMRRFRKLNRVEEGEQTS